MFQINKQTNEQMHEQEWTNKQMNKQTNLYGGGSGGSWDRGAPWGPHQGGSCCCSPVWNPLATVTWDNSHCNVFKVKRIEHQQNFNFISTKQGLQILAIIEHFYNATWVFGRLPTLLVLRWPLISPAPPEAWFCPAGSSRTSPASLSATRTPPPADGTASTSPSGKWLCLSFMCLLQLVLCAFWFVWSILSLCLKTRPCLLVCNFCFFLASLQFILLFTEE